jgi:hypothetical protein
MGTYKLGSILEKLFCFDPKKFLIFKLERPQMYIIRANRYTDTLALKKNS